MVGGGAIERALRPLRGASDLSRAGLTCTLVGASSVLTETGFGLAVGLRLLLLVGCLALEGEDVEGPDADDLPTPQRDYGQCMRELHGKDAQFWYAIRVFLKKEANDLDVLQVSLEAVSLV